MAEKILIVDDESDLELLIRQRFRKQIKEGVFEFVFAANGREALEKLEQHQEIHMVMTDINMPEMDGLTLLENLKEIKRPIKAVVVSAYGDLQNIRVAMNRGAFDFLTKPVDFNDFEVTIYKTKEELSFILESIEAKKQLEHEKVERIRAEEKEKMEKQFLANMSHEIRTPLNAINGMTRLLLMREQSHENVAHLQTIRQSCDNLIIIINDILDLSKIQEGKMKFESIPFKPSESLQHLYDTLHFRAEEKGLALSVHVAPDVPELLSGDPTRLNQILMNLAGNALKFTETGSVTINCSVSQTAPNTNGVYDLHFAVTDTGIGMTSDQLNRIFESFSQASMEITRKYGGTGLGLTISKQLIELQDGSISVNSEYGKGTRFSFSIPYKIADENISSAQSGKADAAAIAIVSKMKVILAEDNDFNQLVAVGLLQEMAPGISIDCVENGKVLLQKISEKQYDLILMDVQMPEMDGIEATAAIRKSNNPIPIIAMTAGITGDEVARCAQAGTNDFVPKPFNPDELVMKMAALAN